MLDKPRATDNFDRDSQGRIVKNEGNLLRAISWAGIELSFDDFGHDYCIAGLEGYGPRLDDDALDELFLLIAREYFFKMPVTDFRRIVRAAARRNRFHPVRNYLSGLRWDGLERLDTWLIDYAGAPDTPFVRAVGRIMLIAAVRRVRDPGCKFDEMLVLESPEGRDKSTAFRVLAGEEWFTDEMPLNSSSREVIEQLRGHWIIECADLKGLRKAEVTTLKAFLSRQVDTATLKYKEETTRFKRQCIFVGTTNEANYLLSTTGNRRFWPVPIDYFDIDALRQARDQLWAEAALCEDTGESIRLSRTLWDVAREEQSQRTAIDEWDEIIAEWLEAESRERNLISPDGDRTKLKDVAKDALNITADKLDQRAIERIAKGLRAAGWMRIKTNSGNWWVREA